MNRLLDLEPGDIFITRNAGDDEKTDNPTPGWYNHAAVYAGEWTVIEAQRHVENGRWTSDKTKPGAVITAVLHEFWHRYPIIRVRRLNALPEVRQKVADHAVSLIGTPYWGLASIFRWLRRDDRGYNCVAVARASVKEATGRDPRWKRPDHINVDGVTWKVFDKELIR
jgi:uncharacterized protein YycO